MAKKLPYYRWFPADARGDIRYASMSDTQRGFFHRCLDLSWENGGIPSDINELAAVLSATVEYVKEQWVRVGKSWKAHPTDPDLLVNPRQEEERDYAESKSQKATDAVRSRYGRGTGVERMNSGRSTD